MITLSMKYVMNQMAIPNGKTSILMQQPLYLLFINTIKTKESQFSEEDLKILYYISFTHMVQFPCLCAYFGGFASQEAIKAITNKYTPIKQIMFQDILEFIPEININDEKSIETSIKNFNYKELNLIILI